MSDPGQGVEAAAGAVLRQAAAGEPRAGRTRVIAIDGPSGSGKTTLAAAVQARSGCPVVHLDAIYPGWDGLAQTPALVRDWLLEPLATGGEPGYRRYSWRRGEYLDRVPVPVTDLLVIEGVGSAAAPCRRYLSQITWVQAPRETRRERAMQRDGEIFRPYWLRWAAQEDELFGTDPIEAHAGLVVETGTGWAHSLDEYGSG